MDILSSYANRVLLSCLACFLMTGFTSLPAAPQVSVAVYGFTPGADLPGSDPAASTIRDQFVSFISGHPDLTLVKTDVAEIKNVTGTEQAVAAGKQAQAQYVVYGAFTGRPGDRTVTATVVNTADGMEFTETVSGNSKHHQSVMVRILAYNIRHRLTNGGGYVTNYKIQEGWYPSLAISSGITFLTSGLFYLMASDAYDNKYRKADMIDDMDRYYESAVQYNNYSKFIFATASVMTAATAYFWLRCQVYSNYINTDSTFPKKADLSLWMPPRGIGITYGVSF